MASLEGSGDDSGRMTALDSATVTPVTASGIPPVVKRPFVVAVMSSGQGRGHLCVDWRCVVALELSQALARLGEHTTYAGIDTSSTTAALYARSFGAGMAGMLADSSGAIDIEAHAVQAGEPAFSVLVGTLDDNVDHWLAALDQLLTVGDNVVLDIGDRLEVDEIAQAVGVRADAIVVVSEPAGAYRHQTEMFMNELGYEQKRGLVLTEHRRDDWDTPIWSVLPSNQAWRDAHEAFTFTSSTSTNIIRILVQARLTAEPDDGQ